MKTTLRQFNTSIEELKKAEANNEQIEQNHFGDYLMIKEPAEWNRFGPNYKVWLNHPENVAQGEPLVQIEYAGPKNGYRWETIANINEED